MFHPVGFNIHTRAIPAKIQPASLMQNKGPRLIGSESGDSVTFSGKSKSESSKKRAAEAGPDQDDWSQVTDSVERKKIQNRIAQRNFRKRQKQRLEDLERQVNAPKSPLVQHDSDMDADHESVPDDSPWQTEQEEHVALEKLPRLNPVSAGFMSGFGVFPQEKISQQDMLMHFAQHKQLEPSATKEDHLALLHAMFTMEANPELISSYLDAVEQHFGLPQSRIVLD